MDIFALIDELENLGEEGVRWYKLISLPSTTVMSEERFFELTDKIRAAIPQEVTTADQITRDRERILAEAHDERAKILNAAKEQATLLVSNDRVVAEAQKRGEEIIRQANVEAAGIRDDADRYAAEAVDRLEGYTRRIHATVEKTREMMADRLQDERGEGVPPD
ncbi:MAG: hypothetical protein PVH68_01940 [Armatimonadota bacterium]|jgi:hypothetical protein